MAIRVVLAVVLALGGLQGVYLLLLPAFRNPHMIGFALLGFYLACMSAAYFLWRRPGLGLGLAFVLLCFQVPYIDSPTVGYRLASGIGSWLQQTPDGWNVNNNWTSCFSYKYVTGYGPNFGEGPSYYGVNVFAIALIGVTAFAHLIATGRITGQDKDVSPIDLHAQGMHT